MGADGHISIYDLDKILNELKEDELKPLLNSQVYIQSFEGRKLLTEYWGDNLWNHGSSHDDQMGGYEKYDWFIPLEEWNRRWEIIEKYKIAQWEVWT